MVDERWSNNSGQLPIYPSVPCEVGRISIWREVLGQYGSVRRIRCLLPQAEEDRGKKIEKKVWRVEDEDLNRV